MNITQSGRLYELSGCLTAWTFQQSEWKRPRSWAQSMTMENELMWANNGGRSVRRARPGAAAAFDGAKGRLYGSTGTGWAEKLVPFMTCGATGIGTWGAETRRRASSVFGESRSSFWTGEVNTISGSGVEKVRPQKTLKVQQEMKHYRQVGLYFRPFLRFLLYYLYNR